MELMEAGAMEDVQPGYKRTEVGVIPEDWSVQPLGALGVFSKGQGIKRSDIRDSGVPCIRYGELYTAHHDVVRQFHSFITPEIARTSRLLSKGDLLFAGSGETKEEIGKCVAYVSDDVAYAGGDIVILSLKVGDPVFFGYLMNSPDIVRQKASLGQGDAVVHIGGAALSKILVPLPPTLTEQRLIASALSDADGLVAGLEAVLAKKRAIKQGALQALLTPPGQPGHRRLPGFSGGWGVKRFESLAKPRKERVTPSVDEEQHFCIELEHIESGTGRLVGSTWTSPSSSQKTRFLPGDVLFGKLRAYLRKYWLADREGVCSTEIWALQPNLAHVTSEFLKQLVMVPSFIEIASMGFGTHMPRTDWKLVREIEMTIPDPTEQTAIAAVLSDMDAELRALEGQLAKLRAVKQGMMQELLTGRKRLG